MKQNPKESKNPFLMNKASLILSVSELPSLSKEKATKAIDALIESIKHGLKEGNDINIPRFGTFYVSKRTATTGRNPKTGEPVKIKAGKFPRFRASQKLKEAIS